MKVSQCVVRTGLLCILLFLQSTQESRAAGVTIITHGFQFSNNYPTWVDEMGNAIALRAGAATVVYHMEVGSDFVTGLHVTAFTYESGIPLNQNSTNAEVVVKLFWHTVAGVTDTYSAANIATVTVPFLVNSIVFSGQVTNRPLAELPVHLIGHSRGAAVVSEISRLLAQQGVWVDHLTLLDPHPANQFVNDFPVAAVDPPIGIYDNVVFADNYYQLEASSYPSGEHVDGTMEQNLNDRFANDGLSDGVFDTSPDHTEIHDWYHGTIDTNATTVAGDPIPRAAWYVPGDIGFRFSLIAKGRALREQIQSAYTGNGSKWAGATRTSATRVGQLWPNIELENSNNVWTVVQGNAAPILFKVQNSFSTNLLTVEFGTDDNQNPYNNTAANIVTNRVYPGVISTNWSQGTFFWTPTIADNGKYLYAKITDYKGFVRYYYLSQPFQVLPPPNNPPNTPVNLAPANGAANQPLTPTLLASAFSDPDGDAHASSRWIVRRVSDGVAVFDSLNDTVNKTSIAVPTGKLTYSTAYSWTVACTDSRGAQGNPSTATSFTTQAKPNSPPNTPVNLAPLNGAMNQSLTPTLQASAFSDPDGDAHASSRWIVRRVSDGVAVFDSLNDTVNKTSIAVPTGKLTYSNAYTWTVAYTDNRGAQGTASAPTTFATLSLPQNPVLLSPQLMADGRFTAILSGETGRTYVIEASTNFVNWTQINTNTLTSPTAPFIDSSSPGLTRRFYRAVAQ